MAPITQRRDYEGPGDIHTVGRNASNAKPAQFLVLSIKEEGVPPFIPLDR